ncbi:MAG: hypothetical protein M3Z10_14590 [Gemmatimonadota bacterium]|nr:hypothetical protein [Gemmatimonadota bacterium]
MTPTVRSFVAGLFVAAVAGGCADSGHPTLMSPYSASPSFARIKATDSTMTLTDISYSDTALVLKRITPLASDISQSMVIGPAGGEINVQAAGGKIDFPAGALAVPTLITMTALAGPDVAYDFQPHGLTFAQPVKIQQTVAGTWAALYPTLLTGMHGSYYGTSLSAAWVDPGQFFAHVDENEIGYVETNKSQIKFFIGHFSGYMLSCGRQ